jgi:hypothetical protein
MRKKTTTSQRIRSLIDSGYNNKAIIEKIKCKPQAVYNIRYQLNKARGLGSIGELPNPTNGIGVPPKKRTRKIRAGELASIPPTPVINPAQNVYPIPRQHQAGEWVDLPITMTEKPTLWQRIKGWFRA